MPSPNRDEMRPASGKLLDSSDAVFDETALLKSISDDIAAAGIPVYIGASRVARAVHLASATLPAAGAYTNQTAYAIPVGVKSVSFILTYTRGAAGGQAKYRILVGNGTEEGDLSVVDVTLVASQPFASQQMYGQVLLGEIPQSASAVSQELTVNIQGGWTTIRVIGAENGVSGTPGTLAIALTAAY